MKSKLLYKIGVLILSVFLSVQAVMPASAKACTGGEFLGLKPWYYGLECDEKNSPTGNVIGDNSEGAMIKTIIVNIITDAVSIAGIFCVGFIIYAGYQIVMSGGDASKYAKGKKTLTGAVIGLVIIILAKVVVEFVLRTLMIGG